MKCQYYNKICDIEIELQCLTKNKKNKMKHHLIKYHKYCKNIYYYNLEVKFFYKMFYLFYQNYEWYSRRIFVPNSNCFPFIDRFYLNIRDVYLYQK